MKQTRITRFYPLPSWESRRRPGPDFLDFPVYIRERIYILAGLPVDCHFDLTAYPEEWEYDSGEDYGSDNSDANGHDSHVSLDCRTTMPKYRAYSRHNGYPDHFLTDAGESWYELPFELLFVSRAVSQEVSRIFYSRNSFRISLDGYIPSTESIMAHFSSDTLAALACLTIRANVHHHCRAAEERVPCPCKVTLCPCEESRDIVQGLSSIPSVPLCVDAMALPLWDSLIDRLKSHIKPNHLKLAVVFDMDSLEMAVKVSKSILDLPLLKHCAVRLCPRTLQVSSVPLGDLKALAETTTQLAARGWTRNQRSVLSQEMPPTAHVATREWTSNLKSIAPREIPHEVLLRILEFTDLVCPYDLEWTQGVGFDVFRSDSRDQNTCSTCISVVESSCDPEILKRKGAVGYECPCWKFPINLFLISRVIQQEALRIFFSKNHFNLLPQSGRAWHKGGFGVECTWDYGFPALIERMPRSAIKHLRSIQFVLPQFPWFCETGSQSLEDLRQTARLLKREARLSELTVTVDMATDRSRQYTGVCPHIALDIRIAAASSAMEKIFPFEMLSSLKDFFVHLSEPSYDQDSEQEREDLESSLEKNVMDDDYDALARGKFLQWRQAPQWWKDANGR